MFEKRFIIIQYEGIDINESTAKQLAEIVASNPFTRKEFIRVSTFTKEELLNNKNIFNNTIPLTENVRIFKEDICEAFCKNNSLLLKYNENTKKFLKKCICDEIEDAEYIEMNEMLPEHRKHYDKKLFKQSLIKLLINILI